MTTKKEMVEHIENKLSVDNGDYLEIDRKIFKVALEALKENPKVGQDAMLERVNKIAYSYVDKHRKLLEDTKARLEKAGFLVGNTVIEAEGAGGKGEYLLERIEVREGCIALYGRKYLKNTGYDTLGKKRHYIGGLGSKLFPVKISWENIKEGI